ncbi:MAG TPA: TIGR02147 family protein [Polyangiaceae bacterium]|nr:TIGR02147 family protein [Polyangiaceae bacterium]
MADDKGELPSVYEYVDYRRFLEDHYKARKRQDKKFSFRFFARRAGLSSSNFLKLVMDGKRNLGATTIDKFVTALKLTPDEASFFADLVAFDQAETVVERNRAFERVAANRRFRRARRLEGPLFRYLTRWYYPAVRELAGREDFKEDPAWIAKQLTPTITVGQARSALKTLQELGLLVADESGRLVRGDTSLTTGHEVRSVVIPAYHRQMIERAADALERVVPEERDMSALTVCIKATSLADLKERIHRFREEMLERCDREEDPQQVYQLCIQLFPLSKPPAVDDG